MQFKQPPHRTPSLYWWFWKRCGASFWIPAFMPSQYFNMINAWSLKVGWNYHRWGRWGLRAKFLSYLPIVWLCWEFDISIALWRQKKFCKNYSKYQIVRIFLSKESSAALSNPPDLLVALTIPIFSWKIHNIYILQIIRVVLDSHLKKWHKICCEIYR